MRSVLKISVTCIGGALLAGCATATHSYDPPLTQEPPQHEIIVDEDFGKVWDRLVERLSADFFVINNIEKESRIINVSFSVDKPSQFVDCGMTTRTFKNIHGEQVYHYRTADSSRYSFVDSRNVAFNVVRETKLNGRVNVYIAPHGPKTKINVNTRYVIDVNLQGFTLQGQPSGNVSENWTFSTNQKLEKHYPMQNVTAICVSNGQLEKKILNYALSY